jgi:D-alanyl-D-alanine carboxypeptidase
MFRTLLAVLATSRAVRAAMAIAVVLAVAVGTTAAPAARAMGDLPACRYDDILTAPRKYTAWSTTLVDTILRVPSTYAPPDLVSTAEAGLNGGGQVRKVAIADLTAMADAAKAAGNPIAVQSAYRSYSQQQTTFDYWVSVDGYQGALKVSARPGHSEHQLGLAIDFRSEGGGPPWAGSDWGLTPAGGWMQANAWTFGWVLSYPKNRFDTVCYRYEPWHYRYVGRDLAALIHESGLTVREYLWANFTTALVPPPTGGSPAPGGSAPSAAPSATPELTPEPSLVPSSSPLASPSPAVTPAPPATPPNPVPTPTSETSGSAGPAVVAAVLVALIGLLAGWWFLGPRGRSRRRRTP